MSQDGLSTSALARQLELPVQQLFATLKDYGWIRKIDDGWALTAKGEFEGGRYVNSKRYGRYIVWPPAIIEHRLFQAMESQRLLSAAELGKPLGISARQTNRLLCALGYIVSGRRGWEASGSGQALGGQTCDSPQSGQSYVMWPEDMLAHPPLRELHRRSQRGDDLLSECRSADGRQCSSDAHRQVANWLYFAGLRYASAQPLAAPTAGDIDFFLPEYQLCLEVWGGAEHPDVLSARMARAEICAQRVMTVIDIHPEDLDALDEYLSRRLIEAGVHVL